MNIKEYKVLNHASIVIDDNIYFDPYQIDGKLEKAKVIFITHSHYDHLSLEDIKKIIDENTVFVCTMDSLKVLYEFGVMERNLELIEPDDERDVEGIKVKTFPSYNIEKAYHKKSSGWVGYLIEIDGVSYCVCGDTDKTEELSKLKCDVLFVPIGGEFTMDIDSAIELAKEMQPKVVVPIHYGSIVGDKSLGNVFKKRLENENFEVKVFI